MTLEYTIDKVSKEELCGVHGVVYKTIIRSGCSRDGKTKVINIVNNLQDNELITTFSVEKQNTTFSTITDKIEDAVSIYNEL